MRHDVRRTIVIDKCPLFREGFKKALHDAGFEVVAAESDLKNVRLADCVSDRALLIIISSTDHAADDVRALQGARARFPGSILVSLCQDCLPQQAAQLLRAGASAILPTPRNVDDFADVLDLAALGQRVVPIHLVSSYIDEGAADTIRLLGARASYGSFVDCDNKPVRMSTREVEILRCLLAGESNRSIGKRLVIGEATVKVHVKAILRKIKVKNRTQAAIWAISNMTPQEAKSEALALARAS